MWTSLSPIFHGVRDSATAFILALRKDERGLSGVVVAILLILVAVLAIVLIWGFLSGWLAELWENITGQAGGIA